MFVPDPNDFERLAQTATLIPVIRTISADLLTPVSAFLALAEKEPHAFLLESVEGGESVGRYTFLGVRPYMIVSSREEKITIERGGKRSESSGRIFDELKRIFSSHRPAHISGLPPFTSGAVGFFSYDAVRQIERLPATAKDDLQVPDCLLMFFDRLLAFDHVRHELHILATADLTRESARHSYDRCLRDIASIEKRLFKGTRRRPATPVRGKLKLKIKATTKPDDFLRAVDQIKEYIRAGDIFQCVLSQRMELQPEVPPFEIYRALRRVNPSPYLYYLRARLSGSKKLHVVGSSPEMLVKAAGRKLEYRPIAGTRWRGKDEVEDQRLEAELRADEKERAEHVMLVDLGRNDLGRVSEPGSVKVKQLMFVEHYSHVMHLVSALESTLRKDLTAWDALVSCFPAGTLTGAPKIRAMEIIEELEPVRRGVYGGAILYADFAGNLDSCIAIRTMLVQGERAYVQAGAGIVADSVPSREYDECLNKAQALIRALERARAAK